MGNNIHSFLPSREEINLPNLVKYSLISLGVVQTLNFTLKIFQKTKKKYTIQKLI